MLDYILGKSKNINDAIEMGSRLRSLEIQFPEHDLNLFKNNILSFSNLKKLSIHVDVRYPYELPLEIGELIKLKKLHILNYHLTEFPDWLFKLINLENLMLRRNDIEEIPERIVELTNLKHLRIENTNLNQIPDYLSSLVNLRSLSLAGNFKLKNIDKKQLPNNLKWLALTPCGIPKNQINEIVKHRPELKMNRRYSK